MHSRLALVVEIPLRFRGSRATSAPALRIPSCCLRGWHIPSRSKSTAERLGGRLGERGKPVETGADSMSEFKFGVDVAC